MDDTYLSICSSCGRAFATDESKNKHHCVGQLGSPSTHSADPSTDRNVRRRLHDLHSNAYIEEEGLGDDDNVFAGNEGSAASDCSSEISSNEPEDHVDNGDIDGDLAAGDDGDSADNASVASEGAPAADDDVVLAAALDSLAHAKLDAQAHRLSLELFEWATLAGLSAANFDKLVGLLKSLSTSNVLTADNIARLKTMRQSRKLAKTLTKTAGSSIHGTTYTRITVPVPPNDLLVEKSVSVYRSCLLSLVESLLTDPAINPPNSLNTDPTVHTQGYKSALAANPSVVYGDLWDSQKFSKMSEKSVTAAQAMPWYKALSSTLESEGKRLVALPVPVIIATDATAAGGLSRDSVEPSYMALANHSREVRSTESGMRTLAFIEPLSLPRADASMSRYNTSPAVQRIAQSVYQEQLREAVFQPFADLEKHPRYPLVLDCPGKPDGHKDVRYVVLPFPAIFPGDHPALADICNMKHKRCQFCTAHGEELALIGETQGYRDFSLVCEKYAELDTLDSLEAHTAADRARRAVISADLRAAGLRDMAPAYMALYDLVGRNSPHAGFMATKHGIFRAAVYDPMHSILLGIVKDTVLWTLKLIVDTSSKASVAVLEKRCKVIPSFSSGYHSLRSFAKGLTSLKFLTASDWAAALPLLISAIGTDDAVISVKQKRNDVLLAVETVLSLLNLVRIEYPTKADRKAILAVAVDLQTRMTHLFSEYSPSKLRYPRFHSPLHLSGMIKYIGTLLNISMQSFEQRHKLAKRAYTRTNGKEWMPQLIARLEELEFVLRVLPVLLSRDVTLNAALPIAEPDFVFPRGKREDTQLCESDISLLPDAWTQLFPAIPFNSELVTWYNSARLRRESVVDISVQHGHCIEVAGADGAVPNQDDPATVLVAELLAVFHYNDNSVLPDGADDHAVPVPPPANLSGEAVDVGQCFMVVRYFYPLTAAQSSAIVLKQIKPRKLRPQLRIEPLQCLYRNVRALPHYSTAAAEPGPQSATGSNSGSDSQADACRVIGYWLSSTLFQ